MYIQSGIAQVVENLPANAEDLRNVGLIPGLGRSSGGGHGYHSSILGWRILMGRGAWRATVHRVANSQKQLRRLCTHAY